MEIDDNERLRHIRASARKVLDAFAQASWEEFNRDAIRIDGYVRNLMVIGEAAYRLTRTGQASVPGIPWASIERMRHRLVHDYYEINLEIVYDTIRDDLPPLLDAVERALEAREAD